jgi:hypothetical protein
MSNSWKNSRETLENIRHKAKRREIRNWREEQEKLEKQEENRARKLQEYLHLKGEI